MSDPTHIGYADWKGLSDNLKEQARKLVAEGQADKVQDVIQDVLTDRFLTRVFTGEHQEQWLLKGGQRMLATIPGSRNTKDVDIASPERNLDESIQRLALTANRDIGDHLVFELTNERSILEGDNQPHVAGKNLTFTARVAQTRKPVGRIALDLVAGPQPVGTPEISDPANRVKLSRDLPTAPYRLYPLADQIADKVCATLNTNYPGGQPSNRVKDLADLVIIAQSQKVDFTQLRNALATAMHRNGIPPCETFTVPETWADTYPSLAAAAPATNGVHDTRQAVALVRAMVDPALNPTESLHGTKWRPGHEWTRDTDRVVQDAASPGARPAGRPGFPSTSRKSASSTDNLPPKMPPASSGPSMSGPSIG